MTPGEMSWVGLLTLMVDGPDLPVHGVISSRMGNPPQNYAGWAEFSGPLFPRFADWNPAEEVETEWVPPENAELAEVEPTLTRVWRAGRRVRLERPPGHPLLIVDDHDCWQFRHEGRMPVHLPNNSVYYEGGGIELLHRRGVNSFAGGGFSRPTGPVGTTTFLGRPAYTVELAPPSHQPFPIQLVVDAETGLVLQQRNDGLDSADEWVEIAVGEPLDDEVFRWQGPSISRAEEEAEDERRHRVDLAERVDWFQANVAALPLRVELDLSVHVHVHQPDGSFEASIGERHLGMLARRPSSDADWQLRWDKVQHRWSADGWDWALSWHGDPLTDAGLDSIKQALSRT